jgi:hypothetical protein
LLFFVPLAMTKQLVLQQPQFQGVFARAISSLPRKAVLKIMVDAGSRLAMTAAVHTESAARHRL